MAWDTWSTAAHCSAGRLRTPVVEARAEDRVDEQPRRRLQVTPGVPFVSLAPLADPALVDPTVALGVREAVASCGRPAAGSRPSSVTARI